MLFIANLVRAGFVSALMGQRSQETTAQGEFCMKAVISRAIGGPQTLEFAEVEVPSPKAGEVLVKVAACGVNYPDALIIEDKYQFKPSRPFSPGSEIAGTIESAGPDAANLQPGMRILASAGWGGMAEKLTVPAERCFVIPDAMPFEEAASFLMTYGTSHYALKDRGHLKPGELLLVLGAAGGVGSAAIEIGKAMGARVIAAASSEEKVAFAKSCGADELHSTVTTTFPSAFRLESHAIASPDWASGKHFEMRGLIAPLS
ncbi:MAG: alcohol dehydrogenase catalytic domain-containing protein [Rhodomicrobium sp.]